jgi:uncharacterized protein (DUF488 family)
MTSMDTTIYTLGHSNHSVEKFLALLKQHNITAIADVRSTPYSRRNPQFNSKALASTLEANGISYVPLGKELGARSDDPSCYENGQVQYGRLAQTPLFHQGIERVLTGARRFRVALMCAEKEPLDCHRTLLVSRALQARGAAVIHILANGDLEPHDATMLRLVKMSGLAHDDLFADRSQLIEAACAIHERKIAYSLAERPKDWLPSRSRLIDRSPR